MINKNINEYWVSLSYENKINFLLENHFWDGFSNYLYQYLPEDIKYCLMVKTP